MVAKITGALCALSVVAYYLLHAPIALVAVACLLFVAGIAYDVKTERAL